MNKRPSFIKFGNDFNKGSRMSHSEGSRGAFPGHSTPAMGVKGGSADEETPLESSGPSSQTSVIIDKNSAESFTLQASSSAALSQHMLSDVTGDEGEQKMSSGDTVTILGQDTNLVLGDKNTKVMYINSDGTLVFNQTDLSSGVSETIPIVLESGTENMTAVSAPATSVNQNYLVVVENMDGYQMLSTSSNRNLLLSSGNDIPSSDKSSSTQISFNPSSMEMGEKSKLDGTVADYTQQITMVLDGSSSQLGPKGILVEPSSFITYNDQTNLSADHLTFHTVHSVTDRRTNTANELTSQAMYDTNDGSFIDISSLNVVPSAASTSSIIHDKPSVQNISLDSNGTQTILVHKEPMTRKNYNKNRGLQGSRRNVLDRLSAATRTTSSALPKSSEGGEESELEELKVKRKKQEQRYLEQCHLEHHMKQTKLKQMEVTAVCREEIDSEGEQGNDNSESREEDEHLEKLGINDETPIFSSITAKLNSAILTHVPGCQQFLLDHLNQDPVLASNISIDSEQNCTFRGSLNLLVTVHNLIKSIMKLNSLTLLDFKMKKDERFVLNKSVMCDLLKPYVSLRGRQPKCSRKASEMGGTNISAYLNSDNEVDGEEFDYREVAPRTKSNLLSSRRRQRQTRKSWKSRGRKKKFKYPLYAETHRHGSAEEQTSDIYGHNVEDHRNVRKDHKSKVVDNLDGIDDVEVSMDDPLQQKLRAEQIKYRKFMNAKLLSSTAVDNSAGSSGQSAVTVASSNKSEDDESLGQDNISTDAAQVLEETSQACVDTPTKTRQSRGRPKKYYDPHPVLQKIQPRNPLTESATTKLRRNYEEHVSFKFFCKQCSFKTKRQSHYINHMRCHKDGTEKKYTCSQCDFVTLSIPMLKRHELRHKENLFSCEVCAAYTTDKLALLKRHMRLRHMRLKHHVEPKELPEDKLSCDHCAFTCQNPDILARHQLIHDRLAQVSDDDVYNCPDCKKNFRSRMHLQRHVRDVHGPEIRPHLCDTCGKAFKRTDALQQHKLVHMTRSARSFRFKCNACGKGFRSPAHLKEHMSMHSSERPFLCQYCGAAFKTQPVQKKHIMTLHIRPKAHVCSVCSRQFNTKHALQRHENTHVKSDPATEAAVLIIDTENAMAEEGNALKDKHTTFAHVDGQSVGLPVGESTTITVEGLTPDMIGTAAAGVSIEEPLEQTGQGLQQGYIQGGQDGTLYYFTGEMPSL